MSAPASQRAEEALLGAIFRDTSIVPEIIGSELDPTHFYFRPYKLVYEEIVEAYYADDPIEPLVIAEKIGKRIAEAWKVSEREAVDRVIALKGASADTSPTTLGALVKRHHDFRELLAITERTRNAVLAETGEPEELAGELSAQAMKIATAALTKFETLSHGDLGRRWVQNKRLEQAAVAAGIPLGAHFGIRAIDEFTKGVKPTELLIAGGEPGVGKSAVWWKAGRNFAQAQLNQPEDRRVGVGMFSLEMGELPSSDRLAQMIGSVESERLRMATLSRDELYNTARMWAAEQSLPIYYNHAGHVRCAQLRAMIVEEIRKHNVGVVIIDHFRFIHPDDTTLRGNDADDEVVMFLKGMAMDLNIAVICLAHTVKVIERADKRPRMSDLRGSGMIAAFADFVCFVYRPYKYASDKDKERGLVDENEAEMLWEKARHSGEGDGEFYMNLSTMSIR